MRNFLREVRNYSITAKVWLGCAALLVAADGTLAGIITDGDLRRALTNDGDLLSRPGRNNLVSK